MLRRFIALALAAGLVAAVPLAASAQEGGDATVTVVHAFIDGPSVDVYVVDLADLDDGSDDLEAFDAAIEAEGDGEELLPSIQNLAPGESEGPFDLPASDYLVVITSAGDPDSELFLGEATLEPGDELSLVAQPGSPDNPVEEGDALVLSIFEDDLSPTACEVARFDARHVADAPAVDLFVDGDAVEEGRGLENGEAVGGDVDEGAYDIEVFVAGTETSVLEAPGFGLKGGMFTAVYVVTDGGGLEALVVDVAVGDDCVEDEGEPEPEPTPGQEQDEVEQPTHVSSGSGGTAGSLPTAALITMLAGLAMIVAPVASRRR
jgi:hypothetical protein